MEINRIWQMPNKNTFDIPAIKSIIEKYYPKFQDAIIVDAFANKNRLATITNDIDPEFDTDYHMDATEFLKILPDNSVDMVLYDPPYSPRQVSECYHKMNLSVDMQQHKHHIGVIKKKR